MPRTVLKTSWQGWREQRTLDQPTKMTMSQYFTKSLYFRKIGVISIRQYTNLSQWKLAPQKLAEAERYVFKIFDCHSPKFHNELRIKEIIPNVFNSVF